VELIDAATTEERRAAFDAAGASCSWCAEPIRLSGGVTAIDPETGEGRELAGGPGRIYYKACGSRRATRCPACAERYRKDARMIVLAGLRGGKGVPEEVREHPAVFATFTAPSFGAVHRRSCRGEGGKPGALASGPDGSVICAAQTGLYQIVKGGESETLLHDGAATGRSPSPLSTALGAEPGTPFFGGDGVAGPTHRRHLCRYRSVGIGDAERDLGAVSLRNCPVTLEVLTQTDNLCTLVRYRDAAGTAAESTFWWARPTGQAIWSTDH
jgi:hypothetical protein